MLSAIRQPGIGMMLCLQSTYIRDRTLWCVNIKLFIRNHVFTEYHTLNIKTPSHRQKCSYMLKEVIIHFILYAVHKILQRCYMIKTPNCSNCIKSTEVFYGYVPHIF